MIQCLFQTQMNALMGVMTATIMQHVSIQMVLLRVRVMKACMAMESHLVQVDCVPLCSDKIVRLLCQWIIRKRQRDVNIRNCTFKTPFKRRCVYVINEIFSLSYRQWIPYMDKCFIITEQTFPTAKRAISLYKPSKVLSS